MDLQQRVAQQFSHGIATTQATAQVLAPAIELASEVITGALLQGHKVLCCGSAGSGGLAQYFAAMLLSRYERERPGLPAMALNADSQTLAAIANDQSYREIYAKQLRVLGQEEDVLLVISANGTSRNTSEAIRAAHDRGLMVVALTGRDGGEMAELLHEGDVEIRVPAQSVARINEAHLLILHILCDLIDIQIFGEDES